MIIQPLEEHNLSCSYDPETMLVYIRYHKFLSPAVTNSAYAWMARSLDEIDISLVHGCIFDFTAVEVFGAQNLTTVRQHHNTLHQTRAERAARVPAALVATTNYQETLIKTSMRITSEIVSDTYPRVKMVRNLEEAKAHFAKWHAEHNALSS